MWIWALSVCWALIVPAVIAFSGFSAGLRNLARKLGWWWFATIGVYVVLYLAVVFLVDFPLHYYVGFVRQHAYGLSNQSIAKWLTNSLLSLGVAMLVGFAFLGALPLAVTFAVPMVAVHSSAFGALPVRDRAGQAGLDRSPVQ